MELYIGMRFDLKIISYEFDTILNGDIIYSKFTIKEFLYKSVRVECDDKIHDNLDFYNGYGLNFLTARFKDGCVMAGNKYYFKRNYEEILDKICKRYKNFYKQLFFEIR
jgi:hypothetical protein